MKLSKSQIIDQVFRDAKIDPNKQKDLQLIIELCHMCMDRWDEKNHGDEKFPKIQDAEWVQPVEVGYQMACCDCGLVHSMDFRIHEGKIQFRAGRNDKYTEQLRVKNNYEYKPTPSPEKQEEVSAFQPDKLQEEFNKVFPKPDEQGELSGNSKTHFPEPHDGSYWNQPKAPDISEGEEISDPLIDFISDEEEFRQIEKQSQYNAGYSDAIKYIQSHPKAQPQAGEDNPDEIIAELDESRKFYIKRVNELAAELQTLRDNNSKLVDVAKLILDYGLSKSAIVNLRQALQSITQQDNI